MTLIEFFSKKFQMFSIPLAKHNIKVLQSYEKLIWNQLLKSF